MSRVTQPGNLVGPWGWGEECAMLPALSPHSQQHDGQKTTPALPHQFQQPPGGPAGAALGVGVHCRGLVSLGPLGGGGRGGASAVGRGMGGASAVGRG